MFLLLALTAACSQDSYYTINAEACPAAGCACESGGACALSAVPMAGECPVVLTLPTGTLHVHQSIKPGRPLKLRGAGVGKTRIVTDDGVAFVMTFDDFGLDVQDVTVVGALGFARGVIHLTDLEVTGCKGAPAFGASFGTVTIERAVFSEHPYGALSGAASFTISQSAFVHNGLTELDGRVDVLRSTWSSSALQLQAQVSIRQSTLWNSPLTTADGAEVHVFADVITSCDVAARFVSEGKNIVSDSSCGFDWQNVKRVVAPLADNGGPTPTHALYGFSLGVDAFLCNEADQRGVDPVGACDVGAYERSPVKLELSASAAGERVVYRVENKDSVSASEVTVTAESQSATWPTTLAPGEVMQGVFGVTADSVVLMVTAVEGTSAKPVVLVLRAPAAPTGSTGVTGGTGTGSVCGGANGATGGSGANAGCDASDDTDGDTDGEDDETQTHTAATSDEPAATASKRAGCQQAPSGWALLIAAVFLRRLTPHRTSATNQR